MPLFDGDVEALEVRRRDGNRLRVVATAPWWLGHSRVGFDVELRPGWCWMVARNGLYVVGMAVQREGEPTRIAHLEGVAVRGSTWKRRLAAPVLVLSRWRHRFHLERDLDGIARGVAQSS